MFDKNFYCVSSRIENSGQLYGCFKIGPFSRHQSLTFANALRRTLLADRSRCTLSAVQIHEVEHEFSSLMGVRESVVDILLNLEKLIFKIKKPITKPQVAFINFCGPGILRAQHISLPSNFQCVRPSQYIATLEVDGQLTLKLFFSPDWNKFQFFLQNFIFATKEDSKSSSFKHSNKKKTGPSGSSLLASPPKGPAGESSGRWGVDRQKRVQKLLKYTNKNLFIDRSRSILQRKRPQLLSVDLNVQRFAHHFQHLGPSGRSTLSAKSIEKYAEKFAKLPLSRKNRWESANQLKDRNVPSHQTLASTFSLTQILKSRLKIVHYLTNILFKSAPSSYLQRLNVQFQFLNLKTMTIQKLPWLKWRSESDLPIFSRAPSDYPPKKFVPYRTLQDYKQPTKTNNTTISLRTGLPRGPNWAGPRWGANRPTRIQNVSPVFAQKIQENFLFLNGSQCAIEKVNYTLQSNILGVSASEENPHQILPFDQRLTPFSFDPKEPSGRALAKDNAERDRPPRLSIGKAPGDDAQSASSPGFAGSLHEETTGSASHRVSRQPSEKGFSRGLPTEANNHPPNNFKKYKRINNFAEKNLKSPLKYHLKLNRLSPIQRKLRGTGPKGDRPRTGLADSPGASPRERLGTHRPTLGKSVDPNPNLSTSERPDRVASPVGKNMKDPTGRADEIYRPIDPGHQGFRTRQTVQANASPTACRFLSKNEEFILFEIWTDGSILPQTAILRALNELLIEIFPYSLQISRYEKVHSMMTTDGTIGAPKYAPYGLFWPIQRVESTKRPFLDFNRKNSFKFLQNLKRQNYNLSKKSFREKFLNLEIGNFYFDLETYLFLKKQNIHRIIDFLKFLNQKETTKLIGSPQAFKNNQKIREIKITLDQFQIFLNSLIG